MRDFDPGDIEILTAELWEARQRTDAKVLIGGEIVEGEPTGWLDGLLEDAHNALSALTLQLEEAKKAMAPFAAVFADYDEQTPEMYEEASPLLGRMGRTRQEMRDGKSTDDLPRAVYADLRTLALVHARLSTAPADVSTDRE